LLVDDDGDIEPENEDEAYIDDATLDAERGRKNSLVQMENQFEF
jgi:hypothetical protein